MKILYSTVAVASEGRRGRVKSEDGRLDFDLSVPKEMGGDGGDGTNPEQLFAAGYAACFENSLIVAARRRKKSVDGASVAATVGMGRTDGGEYGLEVGMRVVVPSLPREEVEDLVEEAHKVCPYSNAISGNVEVTFEIQNS